MQPDQGIGRTFVDVNNVEKRLFLVPPVDTFRLNSAGHATMYPETGALYLCSAFSRDFYVTPQFHAGADTDPHYVIVSHYFKDGVYI